jgi:hypothetical protein
MSKKNSKKTEVVLEEKTTTPDLPEEVIEEEVKKVEEKMIIGQVRNKVYQKSSYIKTKSLRSHPCNYELPDDIRKYLNNKGWGSNVYLKGEEWLVKHNADLKMIEKLKNYLSEHYF